MTESTPLIIGFGNKLSVFLYGSLLDPDVQDTIFGTFVLGQAGDLNDYALVYAADGHPAFEHKPGNHVEGVVAKLDGHDINKIERWAFRRYWVSLLPIIVDKQTVASRTYLRYVHDDTRGQTADPIADAQASQMPKTPDHLRLLDFVKTAGIRGQTAREIATELHLSMKHTQEIGKTLITMGLLVPTGAKRNAMNVYAAPTPKPSKLHHNVSLAHVCAWTTCCARTSPCDEHSPPRN